MIAALLSSVSFLVAEPISLVAAAPVMVDAAPAAPASVERAPAQEIRIAAAATTPPAASSKADDAPAFDLDKDDGHGGPPVFAGKSDEQVADAALQYIEGLTTLAGDFIQTAPSGVVTSGKFYLRRPGQVRFDYDAPSPLTIVASQGMVYVQNDELETTDSYPLKKTPLRFLLAKKIDLSDARLASVERDDRSVAVTWTSTDDENAGDLTLELAAPDFSIERWAVRDPQNGVTVVDLRNVKSGEKLANRLFAPPEAGGAFINK